MATKTYPYAVIWGGKIVPPNTPIEVKDATVAENATVAEKPKKRAVKKNDGGADK